MQGIQKDIDVIVKKQKFFFEIWKIISRWILSWAREWTWHELVGAQVSADTGGRMREAWTRRGCGEDAAWMRRGCGVGVSAGTGVGARQTGSQEIFDGGRTDAY